MVSSIFEERASKHREVQTPRHISSICSVNEGLRSKHGRADSTRSLSVMGFPDIAVPRALRMRAGRWPCAQDGENNPKNKKWIILPVVK